MLTQKVFLKNHCQKKKNDEACDIQQVRTAVNNCKYAEGSEDKNDYGHCVKLSIKAQNAYKPCNMTMAIGGKRRKTVKKSKKSQKKRRGTRAKKPKNKSRR